MLVAVSNAEHSRVGASIGSWEVLAEVAPEPRELGSLEVGLEWQGRAWYLRSGACSLVGNPVRSFVQQVQQGAATELGGAKPVPHLFW